VVTADAASRLGVSEDWLYRNSGRLPFTVRLSEKAPRYSARGSTAGSRARLSDGVADTQVLPLVEEGDG
jgi:hypothetical protein